MSGSRALSDVADGLYALAPENFIAARDVAVRAARDDGDRELATAVKQFRRPSIGAWLVNQLVRNAGGGLDEFLDLGAALRDAQAALDGAELRAMSRQRHQVIRALSVTAGELAARAGHRVGDAAQREFESTLEAALADEQAAHGVRTGRLMRALTSTGLEPVDLGDAIAAPDVGAPSATRQRTSRAPTQRPASQPEHAAKQVATRREAALRVAAEHAARDARADLDRADSALANRQSELAAARAQVEQARDRVAELDAALVTAHEQQAAAEHARRVADRAVKAAGRARDTAQRAADSAATSGHSPRGA